MTLRTAGLLGALLGLLFLAGMYGFWLLMCLAIRIYGPISMTDSGPILCTPKHLHRSKLVEAAANAIAINPANRPNVKRLLMVNPDLEIGHLERAALSTQYWSQEDWPLTVGFLDNPPAALRKKILAYANKWSKSSAVSFVESKVDPIIRISRLPDHGLYSYVGTDNKMVPKDRNTMNLEGYTLSTPDEEFDRSCCHEFGHGAGLLHEHVRPEIIKRILRKAAYRYYLRTQGWGMAEVDAQVLTPPDPDEIYMETPPDELSIMCYHLPAEIMRDHKPVIGGLVINANDYQLMARVYPKVSTLKQKRKLA